MPKFRKKPVVIEAYQWDGSSGGLDNIRCNIFPQLETLAVGSYMGKITHWRIGTLEGGHEVSPMDYIIKGIKGEFYPYKPDIFLASYEPVAE